MIFNSPLQWPEGWKRTEYRNISAFRTGVDRAVEELKFELRKLDASDIIVTSNMVTTPVQGKLAAEQPKNIADPGVAVYFIRDDKEQCVPLDRWVKPVDNLHAIALILRNQRQIVNWGSAQMVDASLAGFVALPETASGSDHWTVVLELPRTATLEEIDRAYRQLARRLHPDVGGNETEFLRIQAAVERARAEVRA